MALTSDKVHEFMLNYQAEHRRPPSLSEIAEAIPELRYRSSARYTVRTLVAQGKVMPTGPRRSSRRYVAIESRGIWGKP